VRRKNGPIHNHGMASSSTGHTANKLSDLVARVVIVFALVWVCACGGHSQNDASSNTANANNNNQARAQDNASQATAQGASADASSAAANSADNAAEEPNANLVPIVDAEKADLITIKKPWTGDFDDSRERPFIRALVSYDRSTYFMDGKN